MATAELDIGPVSAFLNVEVNFPKIIRNLINYCGAQSIIHLFVESTNPRLNLDRSQLTNTYTQH